jgi:hypothetical protein
MGLLSDAPRTQASGGPVAVPCPVCGDPAGTLPVGSRKGRFLDVEYRLRHCPSCRFTFVENPSTDLAAIYDERYYRGQGADPSVDYVNELDYPGDRVRVYEWRGIFRRRRLPGRARARDAMARLRLRPRGPRPARPGELALRGPGLRGGLDRGSCPREGDPDPRAGRPGLAPGHLRRCHGDRGDRARARPRRLPQGRPRPAQAQRAPLPDDRKRSPVPRKPPRMAVRRARDPRYFVPEIHVSFFEPGPPARALALSGFRPEFVPTPVGYVDIIRFKVLKNLGVSRRSMVEKLMP